MKRKTKPTRRVAQPVKPAFSNLKSQHSTRLINPAHKTVTGTRYDFQPGEQQPVDNADVEILLSIIRPASKACCGGGSTELRYFVEV